MNTSSSFTCFLLQQASDNVDTVKGIERRVQLLSGVLASPVSEDDYAEKARRVELQKFVPSCANMCHVAYPLSGSLRGLSQSLNHYLTSTRLLGSYAMLIMPKF